MHEQALLKHKMVLRVRQRLQIFRTHRWQSLLGLLLFGLINSYIAYRLFKDWDQIRSLSQFQLNGPLLGFTASIQFIGVTIAISGWMYMLHRFGYKIPFRRHFKNYALSSVARKLPGIGWNIISRVYLYEQSGVSKLQISVASVTETVIFGISGAIVTLLTMLVPSNRPSSIHPAVLLIILAVFLLLVLSPWTTRLIQRMNHTQNNEFQLQAHDLLIWSLINTATITLGGIALFTFCRALGVVDDTAMLPLIQSWALTVVAGSVLFWVPSLFDISNSVIILMLSTMMPVPQAMVLLIAWRVWCTLNEVLWGGVSVTF